ncbi:MAG: hypothetical protein JXR96_09795 [Deltaproteobacteria bacterium]|nr:hypothetical protein [Deltaproteobacteria bacterium]
MKKLLATLALGLLAVTAWAGEQGMARQYLPNLDRSACEAVRASADFLAGAQLVDDGTEIGWSWEHGGSSLAANQGGLVGLALLSSYEASGDEAHLHAVARYADALVARAKGSHELGYKADIELLARLGSVLGDPVYTETARVLFARHLERAGDGQAELARLLAGRKGTPALVGFDAALGIRAALAVGERGFAYELADAVKQRSARWYRPVSDARFALISAAALVPALESLDEAHYARLLGRLRADLVRAQGESGAWLGNETQLTAYAVAALWSSPEPLEREAAQRGARWLKSTMLRAGSFALFNDYMPEPFVGRVLSEVNAEVLAALMPACRDEQQGR